MVKSKEPVFDPWQTSVFHVVKQAREDYGRVSPPRRSKSSLRHHNQEQYDGHLDQVAPEPVRQPRYYTSISTQTDDVIRQYGGYISARSASRGQGANNFYQRLTGRMSYEPQTARGAQDRIPYVQMDGMKNKHYVEPGPPLFRAGRAGAPWRHIKQCIGNLGNHICFVDGQVKENDMRRFPPYGYVESAADAYHMPRLGTAPTKRHDSGYEGNQGNQTTRYSSTYNDHAKQGFKYWHDDKPKAGAAGGPKQTIQGRMMKMGIGY